MVNLHLRIRIKCQMSNRDLYWLFLCIHFVEASTENVNQICSPMIGEFRLLHDTYRYIQLTMIVTGVRQEQDIYVRLIDSVTKQVDSYVYVYNIVHITTT